MAEIDYNQIQLIVENNMRNAGLQGQFENGWKDVIVVDGKGYAQQFNLQGLRDIIAKSIVDAITNSQATGSMSIGSVQGSPIVIKDLSKINITVNSTFPSQAASRIGDDTKVDVTSDPQFIGWIQAVNTFITAANSPSNLSAANAAYIAAVTALGGTPSKADGKITSGSSTVEIGD